MAVIGLQPIVSETKVEIRNNLGIQANGTNVSNIVHIKLSLVELINAGFGTVEIHTHGNT